MKIEEGIKLKPPKNSKIVDIPDTDREEFSKFLFENGYKVGVEIGVNFGEYGVTLCKAGLKMYGVDCWENYDGYKREGAYKSQKDLAVKALKGLDYTIIHKYSMDALKDFPDDSLDFVYIDANHTLPYVCMDIFGWERKVKHGGIIAGHDYATITGFGELKHPMIYDGVHVKVGVDACVQIMKIPKLYVLGAKEKTKGIKRDKWRSFFFFRP